MSFANKLGASYEGVREQVKVKSIKFDMGEVKFTLRVRIPLKKQMEALMDRITNPDKELVEQIYKRFADPVQETLTAGGEDFLKVINSEKETITVLDNDLLIDGQSVRQVATFTAMWETKVAEYFHLLQSETGEEINETYEQITQEFPEPVIREIVDGIESAIRPDYKTAKKN